MQPTYRNISATVILLAMCQVTFASTLPANGDTLNYTHVQFRWDQEPGAATYELQVARFDTTGGVDPFVNHLVADLIDSTLLSIVTQGISWGQWYAWRVRSIDSTGNSGDWSSSITFCTDSLPAIIPDLLITIDDTLSYQPGLTATNLQREGIMLVADMLGNPVLVLSQDPAVVRNLPFAELLPDGTFLTGANIMSLDNEVLWLPPTNPHHAILTMPSGNIMALTSYERLEYIPAGPWTADFDTAGIDSIPWKGDLIVEWDQDGNEVWSWDVFDHFSTLDYDSADFSLAFNRGLFDWTHANALHYDPVENAVYLCVRHLDRITKIDYATGDVIWNMGKAKPSGDVKVGNDLAFNHPHAIEMLENGNLIFYDNGNYNIPQISRGIEVALTETDSFPTAEIAWQYVLPDSLYTASQGDCDRLPNGNSLITVANPTDNTYTGRIIEVNTGDNSLVWQLQLGPNGARRMYAADRIPGLYPQAFSVVQIGLASSIISPTRFIHLGEAVLEYRLYNEGWMDESYSYNFTDTFGWFSGSGTIDVAAGGSGAITISGTVEDETYPDNGQLIVIPSSAPEQAETLQVEIWSSTAGVADPTKGLPTEYALHPIYPNPFNPAAVIRFDLPTAGKVQIQVYDLTGRQVQRLMDEFYPAGYHQLTWNPVGLASGVYLLRFEISSFTQIQKAIYLK